MGGQALGALRNSSDLCILHSKRLGLLWPPFVTIQSPSRDKKSAEPPRGLLVKNSGYSLRFIFIV